MSLRRTFRFAVFPLMLFASVVSGQTNATVSSDSISSPNAASRVTFVQQPRNTSAGAPISPPVTVRLRDFWGRDVHDPGVSITLRISSGSGTLSGTVTRQTDNDGLATFDDLSIDLAGSKKLTASSPGLSSATSKSFDIIRGAPARLEIQREPSPTVTAGVSFSRQPELWVLDAGGNLVTSDNSTQVTASRLAGTGTLQGTLVATARKGIVTFSNLSHTVAGEITILFSAGALTGDTSAAVLVTASAAAQLVFLRQPSNTPAGAIIAPPVTVRLMDAFGNEVGTSGTSVTMELTAGSGTLRGTLTRSTVAGVATFDDLNIDAAGSKGLTASSGTLTSAHSDAFLIIAREPTTLAFIQQPTGTGASSPISPPVTVQMRDSLGNDVPAGGVNVTMQLASGTGTLGGTTTRSTDGTGLATFNNLSLDQAGQKRLRATSGGLTSALSASFTITAGRETQLVIVQQPTDAAAGQIITPPVTVRLRDAENNDVAKAGVEVALALAAGTSGTLSGTTTQLTDATGLATFSNLSIDLIGVKSLAAIATGLTGAASTEFMITPGPPSRLVFTRNPGNATAGTPFPTQPAVALQDQYENRVTGAPQDVTIAIHVNAGSDGLLTGPKTLPIDTLTGTVSFAGLSIDRAGSGYTLTVTGSTVSTIPGAVVSGPFDITAAAATQIRVETDADGNGTVLGTRSVSSGTSITVYSIARDHFENFVSNTPAMSWSLVNSTGGVTQSDLVASPDRRSATFTGGAVGTAVINAFVPGMSAVPSGTITVVNNANAARILIETSADGTGNLVQDQTMLSGDSIVVYAVARDLSNNFVSNIAAAAWSLVESTGGVSAADLVPHSGGKSATLTGRLVGTARIRATQQDLAPTPTGIITVTAGPPSVVSATGGTPQSAKVGTPFGLRMEATASDAAGNPVGGIAVTFDAPTSGASGTFDGGESTVVSDSSGAAVAPGFTANSVAGAYEVTAHTPGAQTIAVFELTNSARAVGRITSVGGTPQTAPAGTAFPVRFSASVQDSFGNPVGGAAITFTAPPSGPGGTFPDGGLIATVYTSEGGIGTAPEFTANLAAGMYTVTATAPGLAAPAVYALTNIAGAAASIVTAMGSQQATEVNTAFSIRFKAVVNDVSGNPVNAALVTFFAPPEGPGGAFPWGDSISVATDTTGTAAAPLFVANTVAGSFNVYAVTQGVSAPATFELINVPAGVSTFQIVAAGGGAVPAQIAQTPFDVRVVAQDRFGNVATAFSGTVSLSSSGSLSQGEGVTPQFTTGVLQSHRVAVQNAGRVVLIALRTGGAEMGRSDTIQVNNPVPIVTGISPTTGARGQNLSLRVSGSGFLQGLTSVLLGNNITTFETVASDSQISVDLTIGMNATEGPRTVLVLNPPPGGGIVTVDDGFVVQGLLYPTSYALQEVIDFPVHTLNGDYGAADYRIVGLPGEADVSFGQFLAGTKNQDWAMYWDNGDSIDYLIPFDATETFSATPGRAFWLLNKGALVINTTVPTVPLDAGTSVDIDLHPGWNLITSPFDFPVAWSDIQSANEPQVLGGVYRFDGSFSAADILPPFEGCLFDNAASMDSLVIPLRQARLLKPRVRDDNAWKVQVGLTVGDYAEGLVSFGVQPGAENGPDAHDWRRPRGVGALPEVYFSHPEWGAESASFATDVRREIGELQTWTMEVRATPGRSVQLTFSGMSAVPERYGVVLVDDEHSRSIDLRAAPEYVFAPATPVSRFRIGVGAEDAVRGLMKDALPKEFALDNNFPNPFNPSTTIPVTVPRTSNVELRVFSILGELVTTLHAGPLEAGRHLFSWDGANREGRAVSAGVYLVQLTTEGGQRFVEKMVLIK